LSRSFFKIMSNERFKQVLIRDKEWLRDLYESDSTSKIKRFLNFASDAKLDTLIKFIHLLSNGVIKMTKTNFDRIEKKYFHVIKKNFENKKSFKTLVASDRDLKLQKLNKLAPVLKFLLFTLFNRNN